MIVLIVEDQESVSRIYQGFVQSLATEIRVAYDIKTALALMRKEPNPELVLLDLRLPDSDQDETLSHVKDLRAINPEVVILVISGLHNRNLGKLSIDAGADAFREKLEITTQTNLFRAIFETLDARIRSGIPAFQASSRLVEFLGQRLQTEP